MRIPSWLTPVSAVLIAATLAACSGGSTPGPAHSAASDLTTPKASSSSASASASASAHPRSAFGPGASAQIDACKLLTRAQASARVGIGYTSAVARAIAPGQDQCTYRSSDSSGDLVIIVYQPGSGVSWPMMATVLSDTGTVKAVGGVGDKAMVGQIELDVQAGQRLVAIQGAGGLLSGGYSKAVAVAKVVVSALS